MYRKTYGKPYMCLGQYIGVSPVWLIFVSDTVDIWADWWGKPDVAAVTTADLFATTQGRPRRKASFREWGSAEDRKKYERCRRLRDKTESVGSGPFVIQPTVKIRMFAHPRVTLTAYDRIPPVITKRRSDGPTVREIIGASAPLVKRRETRRGFKIGNRWRFRPAYNRFTSHGRNMVYDGCHLLETRGSGQAVFVTLTFPGGTRMAYAAAAAGSGYIVDRINRWLRSRVVDGLFAYVWELQQRGAPHLHYLFRLPIGVPRAVFECHLKTKWREILDTCSDQSGVDLYARLGGGSWRGSVKYPRIEVKAVRDSIGGYLAKYASKDASKGARSSPFRPGRWWGVSYPLRKKILVARIEVLLPVESVEAAVKLAETVCNLPPPLVTGFKWAPLALTAVTRSVSIGSTSSMVLPLVAALFEIFGDGTAVDHVNMLTALVGSWVRST